MAFERATTTDVRVRALAAVDLPHDARTRRREDDFRVVAILEEDVPKPHGLPLLHAHARVHSGCVPPAKAHGTDDGRVRDRRCRVPRDADVEAADDTMPDHGVVHSTGAAL